MPLDFESLSIFSTGYLVGLSGVCGYFAFFMRKHFALSGGAGNLFWTIFVCPNIIIGAINPVVLIAMSVVGDQGMDRPDFWPRMALFLVGIILGLCVVFLSTSLIERMLNKPAAKSA